MKASILALTISTALSANAFAQSTKVDVQAANAATHELIDQQMRDIDASVQAQLAAKYADAQPGDIAVIDDVVYEQQSNGTWAAVGTASATLVAGLLTTSSSSSTAEDDAVPSLPVYTQPDNDLPIIDDGGENTPPAFSAPTMNAKFHYEDGEFKNSETGQRVAYVDDRNNVVIVKEDGTRTKVGKVSHIEDSNAPTTIEFNNGAVVTLDNDGQPNDIVRANGDVYGWTADGGFYLKPIDQEIEHTPTPDNDLPNVDMPTQEGVYSVGEKGAILIDGNETGYYVHNDSNDSSAYISDGNGKVADIRIDDSNGKKLIIVENNQYRFVIDAETGQLIPDSNGQSLSSATSKEAVKQKLQNIDQNKLNQVKAKVQSRLATLKK